MMPTKTAPPKAQLHDALVYKTAEEIDKIEIGDDLFVEYWECCSPSERPDQPSTGLFRRTGDWVSYGLNSKRVNGVLIGDHLNKSALLIVGPCPQPPRKKGRKKNEEEGVPVTRVSLYTTP